MQFAPANSIRRSSSLAAIATAYRQQNAAEFNQAVAEYQSWLAPNFAREVRKGRAEYYYNTVKAFLHATIIYIAAFVLAGGALLTFGLAPGSRNPCAARRFTW